MIVIYKGQTEWGKWEGKKARKQKKHGCVTVTDPSIITCNHYYNNDKIR